MPIRICSGIEEKKNMTRGPVDVTGVQTKPTYLVCQKKISDQIRKSPISQVLQDRFQRRNKIMPLLM